MEFCDCFVKIRQQLISNKEELEEIIIKLKQQHEYIEKKLEETYRTEPQHINKNTTIRDDAILRLEVVEAQNLPNRQHKVVAKLGKAKAESSLQKGVEPIWNQAMTFDVKTEEDPFVIDVVDEYGSAVISEKVYLKDHKEYRDMDKPLWLPKGNKRSELDPRLRVKIIYNYSHIQKYDNMKEEKKREILA